MKEGGWEEKLQVALPGVEKELSMLRVSFRELSLEVGDGCKEGSQEHVADGWKVWPKSRNLLRKAFLKSHYGVDHFT